MKEKMMGRIYGEMILSVLFGLSILWMILGISVHAKTTWSREENNRIYLEREQELKRDIRSFLSERGYHNSGVTVGRTIYRDGSIQYKVCIHHGRINALEEKDREALLEDLKEITFEDDNATFVHEFIK